MYTLEEIKEENALAGVRIANNGRMVAELRGGISLTVAATHAALIQLSSFRANDFLHGIALAMTHCTLTGQVPVAIVG